MTNFYRTPKPKPVRLRVLLTPPDDVEEEATATLQLVRDGHLITTIRPDEIEQLWADYLGWLEADTP